MVVGFATHYKVANVKSLYFKGDTYFFRHK